MSWLETLPLVGKWFDKGIDIVAKAVTDKDKQNKLIAHLSEGKSLMEKEIYLKALEIKTIPWVDALHKMSRILLSFACIVATVLLMLLGHEITPTVALILGGPTAAYTIIKKTGNK